MKFWFLQCFFILAYLILMILNFVNSQISQLPYNYNSNLLNFTILLNSSSEEYEYKLNLTNTDQKGTLMNQMNQMNKNLSNESNYELFKYNTTFIDQDNVCVFFYMRINFFPLKSNELKKRNLLPIVQVFNIYASRENYTHFFNLEFYEKYFPSSDRVEYFSLLNTEEVGWGVFDSLTTLNKWIFHSVCLSQEEINYFSVLINDEDLRSFDRDKINQMQSKRNKLDHPLQIKIDTSFNIKYPNSMEYEIAQLGYINQQFLFNEESFENFKFSFFPSNKIEERKSLSDTKSYEIFEFNYFNGEKKFSIEMNKIFSEDNSTYFNYLVYTLSFWIFPQGLNKSIREVYRYSTLDNLYDKYFYTEKNFIFYIKDGMYYISYYNIKERRFYKNQEISKINDISNKWEFFIFSFDSINSNMIIFQFDSCRKLKNSIIIKDIYIHSINYHSKLHIGAEENFKGYLYDFKIITQKIELSSVEESNSYPENLCDKKFDFIYIDTKRNCSSCESPITQRYCPDSNRVKILYEDKKCIGK